MASANSGLQITNLDFTSIKSSLKTFLQQQDTLKDYNFDGSALSVLVDLLAYNTQYNAYYLNMVANEMFLDSAVQRNSVVSHAKLLNYTPKSAAAPKAIVNVRVNQVTADASLTIPKFTPFLSEAIDDVNYMFITSDATTVSVTSNTANFYDLEIVQGSAETFSYTVDTASNPEQLFQIPNATIDTTTLIVSVQDSISEITFVTFNLATDYLNLDSNSQVYFLQEGKDGKYEIYFGDGILGKALIDGNIVNISYVATSGSAGYGANSFTLLSSIGAYSNTIVNGVSSATNGADKESITSIKYTAPKAYAAQGRAVTKEDYIYLIQNNSTNIPIDSVSVWGGEENTPPVYGQIFCAVKPAGGFTLTPTQKQRLITEVIKPISVLTVTPTVVDPDYTYLKMNTKALYDPRKTTYSASQIKELIVASVKSFSETTLNTFNSTFKLPELITTIQNADSSIITNDTTIRLQKKFFPSLSTTTSYALDFGTALKRNYFNAGVNSTPGISVRDVTATAGVRTAVFYEEVPTVVGGIQSISIINQGFGYTKAPTVTIQGDGIGASAYAVIAAGRINSIVITDPGYNYTESLVTITNAPGDTSGSLGYAYAVLEGSLGTLRTYYYDNNVKNILNPQAGTVDYSTGIVTLTNFSPLAVNNDLGQFTISVVPESTIVSSTYNKIIALDEFDNEAITVLVYTV